MPVTSLKEFLNFDNSLFLNKHVLKPNYTLQGIDQLLHRDNEINIYYQYLKDIFRGSSPNNIFVYGKPGLGKTLITKWVLQEVKTEADNRNIDLCIININCDSSGTEHAIVQDINEGLPAPQNEKKKNIVNSKAKQIKYFEHLLDNYPGIVLIVLDEIDKAQNPEIINTIIRKKSELSGQYPCVICITNELNLNERFPPHLQSVLCENSLIISPYDAEQLTDIIRARIKMAFKPNTVDEVVAPLCAALAAQEHGDARRAIDLLRVAGEIAEIESKPKIEEIDVRRALERIEIDRVIEVIKTLPSQSKISLMSCLYVFESDLECNMNNIYGTYTAICRHIDIDPLTQRRVTDLLSELDQLGIIDGENHFKGRYGRKKIITRIFSKNFMLETLFQDYRLKSLRDVSRKALLKSTSWKW